MTFISVFLFFLPFPFGSLVLVVCMINQFALQFASCFCILPTRFACVMNVTLNIIQKGNNFSVNIQPTEFSKNFKRL